MGFSLGVGALLGPVAGLVAGSSGGGGGGTGPLGGYAKQVGSGPLGYQPINNMSGYPAALQGSNGYAGAARSILGGTGMAEGELRRSYEAMFRHRANTVAAGYGSLESRLGGEVAAQGLSPDAVRHQLFSLQPQMQSQIGEARSASDAGLGMDLAQLYKGTGTELAGLKLNEIGTMLQAYLAKQARKSGSQAALMNFGGAALGLGATAFGGPAAGAAASGSFNAISGGGGIY